MTRPAGAGAEDAQANGERAVLRIHFTSEDLSRVRVAAEPDPLWEIAFSLRLLQGRERIASFDGWCRKARAELGRSAALRRSARILAGLSSGCANAAGFRAAIGTCAGCGKENYPAPRACARHPSGLYRPTARCGFDRLGHWDALAPVTSALAVYYQALIVPVDGEIRGRIEAHHAVQSRRMLHGGAAGLLSAFGPAVRWNPPVLEVAHPGCRDVSAGGRGLVFVPSFFCGKVPVFLDGQDAEAPTLACAAGRPAGERPAAQEPARAASAALAALLGRTRAAVLVAVTSGCTTSELARRVGTSAPSASRHAAVLRDAGLVITSRDANLAIHTITPLGATVLAKTGAGALGPAAPGLAAPGCRRRVA
jgi:DNA-binding transcriptional ArsR family regulator